jgi:hypothetical protein
MALRIDENHQAYSVHFAHGEGVDDCDLIAHRTPADGSHWSEFESWVFARRGGEASAPMLGQRELYKMLWRASDGASFVASMGGEVALRRADGEAWERHRLPALLRGVWGLHARCVFVWGKHFDRGERQFRWDGERWEESASPGGVVRMGGLREDDVWLVGQGGLVAHGAPDRWHALDAPTRATLSAIALRDDGTVVICSHHGEVLDGSEHGVLLRARFGGGLLDAAAFGGALWFAAGDNGLLRLTPGASALEPVASPGGASSLYAATERLLVSGGSLLYDTTDGVDFRVRPIDFVLDALSEQPRLVRSG